MKALVVAGAGLHGPFQVGVLRTLIKRDGYRPDFMVGCSVGSTTVLALSCLGFNESGIEAITNAWLGLENISSIFGRNWSFPIDSNGYYNGTPLRELLGRLVLGRAPTIPFELAVHDLEAGETAYYMPSPLDPITAVSSLDQSTLPIMDAVEASYSIPLVVNLAHDHLCDGGVIDCAPVGRAIAMGATDITLILGYSLKMPRWSTKRRDVIALAERLVDVETQQLLIDDVARAQDEPGVSLRIIQPTSDLPIGMLEVDPVKIREVIALGELAI